MLPFEHTKTPHTSPFRASYGVSFVSISTEIDRVIKAWIATHLCETKLGNKYDGNKMKNIWNVNNIRIHNMRCLPDCRHTEAETKCCKIANLLWKIISDPCSLMKIWEFQINFHWNWCISRSPIEISDKSPLVQVMAWHQTLKSHYLNQCWLRLLPLYSITRQG